MSGPRGPMADKPLNAKQRQEQQKRTDKIVRESRKKQAEERRQQRLKSQKSKEQKGIKLNQAKVKALKAHIKKVKGNKKKFKPIFGKKVSNKLSKASKSLNKAGDVMNNRVFQPVAAEAIPALDWAIEHSGEIADGMAISGGVLIVIGTGLSATGVGAVVGGPMIGVGGSLEAAAPVVRSQGARAKKIKHIAEKIAELLKILKKSKDMKHQMEVAADILIEASKINDDKELLQGAMIIKDSIKLIDNAIKHGEIMIKAVKKGDILAGISAVKKLIADVKKGKQILESADDLLQKAKERLTPSGKAELEKEIAEKKEREEARGETRSSLGKLLKSQLFKMAEERNLEPSARLLKQDIITLLLNNPKEGLPKKTTSTTTKTTTEPKEEKLPERKVKKTSTTKRKPSAYNIFIGEKIKEGMTFKEAVAAWNAQK